MQVERVTSFLEKEVQIESWTHLMEHLQQKATYVVNISYRLPLDLNRP